MQETRSATTRTEETLKRRQRLGAPRDDQTPVPRKRKGLVGTASLAAVIRHHLLRLGAQFAAEEALLLGRQTFEDFRGYWPLITLEGRRSVRATADR